MTWSRNGLITAVMPFLLIWVKNIRTGSGDIQKPDLKIIKGHFYISSGHFMRISWTPRDLRCGIWELFALHRDSVILDTTGLSFTVHINYKREPYISSSTEKTEDSADYFKKKLREPDSVISHEIVSADSIGFAADSTIAGLFFKDSLEVSYKYKSIPNRYRALSKDHKHEEYPVSQFVFINQRPVYILKNGFLYKTEDLKVTGYWAWWETMATLLPYDYMPKNE
jgi:hypothetical protein